MDEIAPHSRIVAWLVFRRRRTFRATFIAGTCGGPASQVPAVPWRCLMAATTPSTSLVPVQPVFTDAERLALAGFLAGYRGLTREAHTLDLRQFTGWCRARSLPLFSVRRADIETFARELEAHGRARATVTRRRPVVRPPRRIRVGAAAPASRWRPGSRTGVLLMGGSCC